MFGSHNAMLLKKISKAHFWVNDLSDWLTQKSVLQIFLRTIIEKKRRSASSLSPAMSFQKPGPSVKVELKLKKKLKK